MDTNINSLRKEIHTFIDNIKDVDLLLKIKSILRQPGEPSEYLSADPERMVLQALEESERDIQAGRVYSHEEVMNYFDDKIKNSKK